MARASPDSAGPFAEAGARALIAKAGQKAGSSFQCAAGPDRVAHAAVKVRMNGTLEAAGGHLPAACHGDCARNNDPTLVPDVDCICLVRRFARCFSATFPDQASMHRRDIKAAARPSALSKIEVGREIFLSMVRCT